MYNSLEEFCCELSADAEMDIGDVLQRVPKARRTRRGDSAEMPDMDAFGIAWESRISRSPTRGQTADDV